MMNTQSSEIHMDDLGCASSTKGEVSTQACLSFILIEVN